VLPAGDVTRTVVVDGMSRTYLLHVPAAYNGRAAVPLLLDFHSIAVSSSYERGHTTFPAVTDAEGVVMAFPQGASGPLGAAWNVGPCCVADVDDVKFSLAVVADIESVACIDTARVYATGFSMGGGMAYTLACEASEVFAAIAPSAFDMTEEALPDCKPKRGITVIAFRGTSDNIVRYAGGPSSLVQGMPVTFLGAQGTFQKWGELDQCAGTASASDANGCSRYSGCKDAADVILCTSSGGQDFADATFAWPILKAHSL
jgi:polyhydroxybutyrate depolymerase